MLQEVAQGAGLQLHGTGPSLQEGACRGCSTGTGATCGASEGVCVCVCVCVGTTADFGELLHERTIWRLSVSFSEIWRSRAQ